MGNNNCEYSGFSDPGIDVGYYIVDAMYDRQKAKEFIKEYLQASWTPILERHYLVYTALIAYYWFIWAMDRESCGANVGDSRINWMTMAERFCDLPEALVFVLNCPAGREKPEHKQTKTSPRPLID